MDPIWLSHFVHHCSFMVVDPLLSRFQFFELHQTISDPCLLRAKMSRRLQLPIFRPLTSFQIHTNKVVPHDFFSYFFCKTHVGVHTVYHVFLKELFVISAERRSFSSGLSILFFHCLGYDLLFQFFRYPFNNRVFF